MLFGDLWFNQTKSFIRDSLGDDSIEYQYFFRQYERIRGSKEEYYNTPDKVNYLNDLVKEISQCINNCIETIELKGVHKPPKYNFLQGFTDAQLIGGMFTATLLIFGIGVAAAKLFHLNG